MTDVVRGRGRLLDPGIQWMNKTEAAYADLLELRKNAGEVASWAFEMVNLRLGHKTHYRPDFLVQTTDGFLEFHEVKGGFWRDDARVKIKVAARMYPMFRFVAVYKRGAGLAAFEEEEIKP